ncbi:hypothetical protein [Mucilaginibacter celer]|uniref:Uncharacterized protein n=1 Tax=Mucilaginibacter celer TaxID=2305508 RepID=A0A494VJ81_9SPHI|nr:hypothetical protein [Mucilaginibacter celer]AYL93829.1 hypothetical protein HYN43_000300 [Mucilaginibacter celer]
MRKTITLGMLCCALLGCKQANTNLKQITDSGVTLQVINIKNNDSAATAYKVRIVLTGTTLPEQVTSEAKHGLLYNADSLFYISEGGRKIYPQITQPVANGVANTFEYLVDFDKMATGADASMIYHDKYITKKDYQVKLN